MAIERLHALAAPGIAGRAARRSAPAPAEGLPQSRGALDTTWPASVVTAPPDAFWKGSGMSTFC